MLGGILLLAVLATGWIGIRGFLAYQHLNDARATAANASEVLSDPARASDLIADVSADTAAARDLTSDIVWRLGEQLPWVGPQLAAVSTVATALDNVASESLTPLASVAASFSLDDIRPQNGAIDLDAFTGIEEAARTGATGVSVAATNVAAIDTAALLGPVRDAVSDVSALLDQARTAADTLKRTTILLPSMLGGDGPRDYLVVFQNNAEWRSLGGIVGATALIHTDGGTISLVSQASSSDFDRYDEPVVPMTDEEKRLFGTQPATYVQNVTQIPDFTRDGPIIQAMWERETGTVIDGVLSLDPVALSYLLEATGPIQLPTGDELNGDNAVQLLLNEVYLRYEDPAEQDAFFAAAAASVFQALTAGGTDPTALVDALGRAGTENRLMVWNADPDEQAVLDDTTLQGALGSSSPAVAEFGVYLNDGTSSKMDYYMEASATAARCTDGEAALTVTLRNGAPADAASLPRYITGGGSHGIPPGNVETVTYIYLPAGAVLTSTTIAETGETPSLGGGTDDERQVISWQTQLAPGEEITLRITAETPPSAQIVTRATPTVNAQRDMEFAESCGSTG